MKIAAIDLGSNSIHMVIVQVSATGAFEVLDREKEMVRLGAVTLSRGRLTAAAMRRGLLALGKYKRITEAHRVDKIIARATSAIREAANGEDYVEEIGKATGIWPKIIPGEEEGRLIYLAALHSIHLDKSRALLLDIGGGSVELVVGAGTDIDFSVSEKLGSLRMTERFVNSDPLSSRDEKRLVEHVETAMGPHAERARASGFDAAIGTSGTILALGTMAYQMDTGRRPETLHHLTVQADAVHALRKRLVGSRLKARLKLPGMDQARADIIVAGAVVLDTLLRQVGAKELTLCEWALREGILVDYIQSHAKRLAQAEAYPDVRRRSVIDLAERCQYDERHAGHVRSLALGLFDATQGRHGLGPGERALLEYASLLHGVGHLISHQNPHKHTYYLIKSRNLHGFRPDEVEILASVARYYRRGRPQKKRRGFGNLPRAARKTVRVLAGLLRLADALDRSHRQIVSSVTATERAGTLRVRLVAKGDADLEVWGAQRAVDLLEEALALRVRVSGPERPAGREGAPQKARSKGPPSVTA
jgi:exopolyphosphatase / guanosine-5'-triphosphate,3'-diphosphate pyrophosphatase